MSNSSLFGNFGLTVGYATATVAVALFFTLMLAISVFICLRRVDIRRKMLCFFIGAAIYVIPAVFLLTDINAFFGTLLPADSQLIIPDIIGFEAAVTLGVAWLGIVSLVCSGRVMKISGQIAVFIVTLVFFAAETVLTYLSLTAFTGTNTAQTLTGLFPSLRFSEIGDVSVFAASAAGAILFTLFFFLGFLFNKSKNELKREDIEKFHMIREENARLEKEGVCEVCRFANCEPGGEGEVYCDKKGRVKRYGCCRGFEYDPLKRIPDNIKSEGEDKK